MVPEAPHERTENGAVPIGEGWFVVNVRDARWFDTDGSGSYVTFEGENAKFAQLGFGLGILHPGEPNALYHAEETQEDFLVLAGECLLLVEGQERRLGPWDFVHCPPWTEHIFVGVGDGPCLVLAVGTRRKGRGLVFPVNEIALKHGAGVKSQTSDPREAYAGFSEARPVACPPDFRATDQVTACYSASKRSTMMAVIVEPSVHSRCGMPFGHRVCWPREAERFHRPPR